MMAGCIRSTVSSENDYFVVIWSRLPQLKLFAIIVEALLSWGHRASVFRFESVEEVKVLGRQGAHLLRVWNHGYWEVNEGWLVLVWFTIVANVLLTHRRYGLFQLDYLRNVAWRFRIAFKREGAFLLAVSARREDRSQETITVLCLWEHRPEAQLCGLQLCCSLADNLAQPRVFSSNLSKLIIFVNIY